VESLTQLGLSVGPIGWVCHFGLSPTTVRYRQLPWVRLRRLALTTPAVLVLDSILRLSIEQSLTALLLVV